MAMSEEDVIRILESEEVQNSRKGNPTGHRFETGYALFTRGIKFQLGEKIEPTGHGIIYVFSLEDLPNLEEITLREIGRQGFYYDRYAKRFAYNVREHHGRRTS